MYNDTIDYGKIIKELRKKHNLTQTELGEKIDVGKTAISNYETGYSVPSASVLERIASVFDMNLIEFLSENYSPLLNLSMPRINQPINDRVIPYIKEANISQIIFDSKTYMDSYLTLPGFMIEENGEYFCIKVPDDSMSGDNLYKNDYIIVRKSEICENKSIVLAIHKPSSMYMIRRYIREGHIIALIPSSPSPKYNLIRADERDEDIAIIGYVEKTINNVK